MDVHVRPVGGALGAEVRGVDLTRLDDTLVDGVRRLLREHLVLFFPAQRLSVDAHQHLAEAFGEITANTYIPSVDDDHPGVTIHRSEDGYIADVWHSDGQARPDPVKVTIFHMIMCPSRGGDTMFANQHLVYERLSPPLQDLLEGLTALQRSGVNRTEEVAHPAVIVHPETGRKLLYVSRHHTVRFLELTSNESQPLLGYLFDLAERPEHTCRYQWSPGTVGIWDNLATVHYGVNDFTEPRVFHRVQVAGGELAGSARRWPTTDDDVQRTMVVKDGKAAVVGDLEQPLWAR
jgi:taurine dioxygenase